MDSYKKERDRLQILTDYYDSQFNLPGRPVQESQFQWMERTKIPLGITLSQELWDHFWETNPHWSSTPPVQVKNIRTSGHAFMDDRFQFIAIVDGIEYAVSCPILPETGDDDEDLLQEIHGIINKRIIDVIGLINLSHLATLVFNAGGAFVNDEKYKRI